jgi:hypothetical protein
LQYLVNFSGQFIGEPEISRRANGKDRFLEDSHWAHIALTQLLEVQLLETDGAGRYRVKSETTKSRDFASKFIDPKIRQILEQSGRKFDLSSYA